MKRYVDLVPRSRFTRLKAALLAALVELLHPRGTSLRRDTRGQSVGAESMLVVACAGAHSRTAHPARSRQWPGWDLAQSVAHTAVTGATPYRLAYRLSPRNEYRHGSYVLGSTWVLQPVLKTRSINGRVRMDLRI